MSSTASVASSTDSLQGVEQGSEAATPGSSSFEISSISVSINNSITTSQYAVLPDHLEVNNYPFSSSSVATASS